MSKRRNWFVDSFGQPTSWSRGLADLGNPVADARSELIDEAWFGRTSAEAARAHDLGWVRNDQRSETERDQQSSHEPDREQSREVDRGHDIER